MASPLRRANPNRPLPTPPKKPEDNSNLTNEKNVQTQLTINQMFLKGAVIVGGGVVIYKASAMVISAAISTLKMIVIILGVGAVVSTVVIHYVKKNYTWLPLSQVLRNFMKPKTEAVQK